tara:strand:- start:214 stop:588 length:375 start_codon:yes stop_codon:yes gene_type:complete
MKLLAALKMTGLTLALLMTAQVSQATIITNTFKAEVFAGPYTGTTGTGSFSYDDSLLGGGSETLGPVGGSDADAAGLTGFSFTILGQTFSMSDDTDFPDYPQVGFLAFVPEFLDILVVDLCRPI